jgi:hypothetical protein
VAGDVLASLATMVWNAPSKSWIGGATMADSSLNRRMTVRLGAAVAFAHRRRRPDARAGSAGRLLPGSYRMALPALPRAAISRLRRRG